jgi:tRNA-dihydrouridine synthase B
MLPWFANDHFPVYLAPMAGVTDVVFRSLCKELGAGVMVTEFVSAEGILQRDDRTRHYTEFDEVQRPLGVQLFGADGRRMGEAARKIMDWKQPDFIDINFGCPVNKVVSKNGGSSLLRQCPLLAEVAREVVKACPIPVTAKMRIGWDEQSINAVEVAKLLEDCGVSAIAVHGRTRAQGYSGRANWDVIAEVAAAVRLPVIGNGDLSSAAEVLQRRHCGVRGVMIGRAAMSNPWIFREVNAALLGAAMPPAPTVEERFTLMRRHCQMEMERSSRPESFVLRAMRSALMNYTRQLRGGKFLRSRFTQLSSMMQFEDILSEYLAHDSANPGYLRESDAGLESLSSLG